jgi:biopolymer transport protein ExbD
MGAPASGDDDLITGINVTPLVDVILVLLIIVMVTAEVIHQVEKTSVIDVDLPAAASSEELLNRGLLSLVVDRKGGMYLNDKPADMAAIKTFITQAKARGAKPQALISADKKVPHGVIVTLMDTLRLEGVREIAINTKAQTIEAPEP